MKFWETHFEEYLNAGETSSLHPKLDKIIKSFPKQINLFQNIILFGPNGVGKYTFVLKIIKRYSACQLKYEKKMCVLFNKQSFFYKISDIHYEIDMSLLGCNSKLLWHEFYLQVCDIISTKTHKTGIIVCKKFHDIHNELLDNFYSYIQHIAKHYIHVKFILLTEQVSFIPDTMLNCFEIISVPRPSKLMYKKNFQFVPAILHDITNMKNLHALQTSNTIPCHVIICEVILSHLTRESAVTFLKFRDILYDLFIYNIDIAKCIVYIIQSLYKRKQITNNMLSEILTKTFLFFQYYNNNYRPIYHLEMYMYYLMTVIA